MSEGRSDRRGVEGHADEPKREAYGELDEAPNRTIHSSHYVRGFAAERERRQRMEPALAGIKPGRRSLVPSCPSAIPPRVNVLETCSAKLLSAATVTQGAGGTSKGLPAPSFVHGPVHSGAGGVGWKSEASRQEPGMLESIQGRAGGATTWGQA